MNDSENELLVWIVVEDPTKSEFDNGILGIYSNEEDADAFRNWYNVNGGAGMCSVAEYTVDYRLND